MAEEDSIPMVPSHLIPGRDDLISMLDDMGMGHLVLEQAAPVIPAAQPLPGTRFPPLKAQGIPGIAPGPASAIPTHPVKAVPAQPASGISSPPTPAVPSPPVPSIPSKPATGTYTRPAPAVPSPPVPAIPSKPATGTYTRPASATSSPMASATSSSPASAVPAQPAPAVPEKNPLPAAHGPASTGETGAGIRGPGVFDDPASPGEQYELSTANTIVFLRACDRARKGLTPGELVQFRHLWLKVYGNRV